jgi:hypothetical protein
MLDTRVATQKILATRSKLKTPTSPQFNPPTTRRIRAIAFNTFIYKILENKMKTSIIIIFLRKKQFYSRDYSKI